MKINDAQFEKAIGGQMDIQYGATEQTVPGMECPACGEFIPTTINHILTASSIICPHCQLKINIDRRNGGKAIEALRKVREAQERLENR